MVCRKPHVFIYSNYEEYESYGQFAFKKIFTFNYLFFWYFQQAVPRTYLISQSLESLAETSTLQTMMVYEI